MEHTGFHDKEHFSPDCPKCRQEMRDKTIGVHLSHCYQGESENNCEFGDDDCPARKEVASLVPQRLIEYEKEQNDKLATLKKEIDIKRTNAFSVSLFGDREHQIKMDAMVNAYTVVLNLMKHLTNNKNRCTMEEI